MTRTASLVWRHIVHELHKYIALMISAYQERAVGGSDSAVWLDKCWLKLSHIFGTRWTNTVIFADSFTSARDVVGDKVLQLALFRSFVS